MKKRTRKLMAALLSAAMVLSLTGGAFAEEPPAMPEGEMPPGGMGGMPPGGAGGMPPGGGGQEFATFEEVRSHAAIRVENGQVLTSELDGFTPLEDSDFEGSASLAEGGSLTADGVSGLKLSGDASAMNNGISIDLENETDTFTIGGDETYYTVDGKEYNSVLELYAGSGNNDAGYEGVFGIGAGINTGTLWVRNSYISSNGARSIPVYTFSNTSPDATSLVLENSTLKAYSDNIWMPSFKLLAGGARASLIATLNNSWIYGSEVLANNWGAISQDSVDAYTYVINSTGKATEGGYGAYLTYGLRLYGSELYAGQYGIFMCGNTDVITDSAAAALEDADAMSKLPGYPVDTARETIVAAPVNAIVVHNSLPDVTMVTKATFRNTTLSTLEEDLPDDVVPMGYDDEFFLPGADSGTAYFYNKNLYGSLALIRSMNTEFTFDNADTRTSNGVLLQSVINYDPPSASGYLTPDQGATVAGVSATYRNGGYEGDILHEDYHRSMTVTVENAATLTGKVVSGTWAGWNDKWSEDNLNAMLADDGYTSDLLNNADWVSTVQGNLILSDDAAYADTGNYGVSMTVANGGTWVVTDTSSLASLTIGEGGVVKAADGYTMTVYVGCDDSNSNLTYGYANAPEAELAVGTYEDVVIVVEPSAGTAPDMPEGGMPGGEGGMPEGGMPGGMPGSMPGGSGMPPPPPGGGSMTFYLSDSATELESGSYDGTGFPASTNADEVAVRAGDGVTANLNGVTITKESGDSSGDDTSFYGINSGLLVYGQDEASHVVVTDSAINTSANGGNGVFAYGDGVIAISDSTVTTTASGASGGIMVAGGGTLYALNLDVTTEGGSSAAIRSDRGSGLMVVDQGIYVANGSKGTGSPAIYCVADITVANATMVAKNAQAICFEGRNPAWIYNSWLEGCYTASDDDENSNVMVYQSMSGDSDEGTSSFTMVGGVLKANNTSPNGNAKMFYTTNTYCYINLYDVEMIYSDGMETFLLCACNTNSRGWGTAGANGSECVLYCVEQEVDGNIIYDTWSLLHCYFTGNTVAKTALLCREDNGDRGAYVYMDSTSTWIVTGDSLVNDLYTGGGRIVDEDGKTVSIVGADGTVYVDGDSACTITVTGTYSVEDKSDYASVPVIGTEKPEFVYDFEKLGIDTSVYTPVGEEDYVYTPGASVSVAKLAGKLDSVEAPASFSDVSESDWFYDAVTAAANSRLVLGDDAGAFLPEGELTWAQALAIAVRVYESNNGGIKTTNTASRDWYKDYVEAGISYGVITAVATDPNAPITRAEAAVMFAAVLPDGPAVNEIPADYFSDVAADSAAYDAVYALAKAGIVDGTDNGTAFGVDGAFQRCHAAAIAARMCGLVEPAVINASAQPTPPEGEGGAPAMPEGEGGEAPAMPEGEGGEPPAMPEGEGGGDGTASPEDMVASSTVNADGTVSVTLSGIEMDTYDVNGVSAKGGETVTVTPAADGTVTVSFTGGGGPYLGIGAYTFTPAA